ncbi:putative phosphonate catabolism associated alcohol dehydrogenase [Okibacterium sp. HSC-33S16]|uniref:alcohol dehydrogenase catalytic domain-containing protein n=1 Tax=Okibacterium sp. HSC-33S16 TaxID=2910965 RepID=UPI0020A06BFE|nr:alcohol dehydrogenase catalytic domain-containing protein [Okibacterium sp. HSC-33S16]MCP2031472.1 putative phosphonate catabolism associated alcohol dehydrogenase [Okibacterium sp. HSC-33S16]
MTRVRARPTGRDVLLRPTPVAMVWPGAGYRHEAIAVPGVCLARGDVLVAVELATACGCVLDVTLACREALVPVVLGHEQVGRIVAVADGAVAAGGTPLVVGMRVVWSATAGCGTCERCERGHAESCRALRGYGHDRVRRGWELSGGFASHVHVRAGTALVLIDESLPATVAAPVSCATATAAAAVEAADERVPLAESTVVILGAGMRGLTATAMVTDAGGRVVMSDPGSLRRSAAINFGAVAVADSRAGFRSATGLGGVLAALAASGAREPLVVLDFSGAPTGLSTALAVVGGGGVIVLAARGSGTEGTRVEPDMLSRRQLTLRGVHRYSEHHLAAAVEYLERAWLRYPFAGLVGETFALERVDDALALAATGMHQRVALDPRGHN